MCLCILIITMRMSLPAQMQNKPIIIIAAISSRPYVKAAVDAGYDVIAIDAYLDQDTQSMAKQCYYVPCVNQQFDAQSMLDAISLVMDAHEQQPLVGLSYGAGFEAQPALIAEIQSRLPLLANAASTVKQCKDPKPFLQFCQTHGFATPAIAFMTPPNHINEWLIKTIGGSGGAHVCFAQSNTSGLAIDQYYQKFQPGVSVSCLFLATDSGVSVIGMNEQWVDAEMGLPFKYGGAVSHHALEANVLAEYSRFITLATAYFGLKGLNSVDALLDGERLVFLEINPRLSATLDLYATHEGSLFASHVAAFQSRTVTLPKVLNQPKAHHIVYAKQITKTQAHQAWPDWVCDIPSQQQTFDVGMPICTVVSVADTVHAAKQLVRLRAASL